MVDGIEYDQKNRLERGGHKDFWRLHKAPMVGKQQIRRVQQAVGNRNWIGTISPQTTINESKLLDLCQY